MLMFEVKAQIAIDMVPKQPPQARAWCARELIHVAVAR